MVHRWAIDRISGNHETDLMIFHERPPGGTAHSDPWMVIARPARHLVKAPPTQQKTPRPGRLWTVPGGRVAGPAPGRRALVTMLS